MQNLSYEYECDLYLNERMNKPDFHMKGFALGLILKQRQKATQKWPFRPGLHVEWVHGKRP